jgi:hypothetical protein
MVGKILNHHPPPIVEACSVVVFVSIRWKLVKASQQAIRIIIETCIDIAAFYLVSPRCIVVEKLSSVLPQVINAAELNDPS